MDSGVGNSVNTVNLDIRFEELQARKNSTELQDTETNTIETEQTNTTTTKTEIFTFGVDTAVEKSYLKFAENLLQNKEFFNRGADTRVGFRVKHKSRLGTIYKTKEFLESKRQNLINNSEKEEEKETLDWAALFTTNYTPALTMTATQPPTVINFGMLAKPSIYTHSLDEDIREFIQTFENESVANDWDDNTKPVSYTHLTLPTIYSV